jgi:hypothetical protein
MASARHLTCSEPKRSPLFSSHVPMQTHTEAHARTGACSKECTVFDAATCPEPDTNFTRRAMRSALLRDFEVCNLLTATSTGYDSGECPNRCFSRLAACCVLHVALVVNLAWNREESHVAKLCSAYPPCCLSPSSSLSIPWVALSGKPSSNQIFRIRIEEETGALCVDVLMPERK